MSAFYAKEGKIYASDYIEIFVPVSFISNGIALNKGDSLEVVGLLYAQPYVNGSAKNIQFFNIPTIINLMIYNYTERTVDIEGMNIKCMVLEYMKDAYVMHQSITQGREVAETFLQMVLAGKVPKTISYMKLIDIWWKNLSISGVNFKVPSKIYEMILASIYRSPNNPKERYGQYIGRQNNTTGLDYKTNNVREVVKNLSTFSGMVFEDMNAMITNGINNSINNIEEQESPLEKIIHY
jgi:hypothetical protein